jgi:hypothetical protein
MYCGTLGEKLNGKLMKILMIEISRVYLATNDMNLQVVNTTSVCLLYIILSRVYYIKVSMCYVIQSFVVAVNQFSLWKIQSVKTWDYG